MPHAITVKTKLDQDPAGRRLSIEIPSQPLTGGIKQSLHTGSRCPSSSSENNRLPASTPVPPALARVQRINPPAQAARTGYAAVLDTIGFAQIVKAPLEIDANTQRALLKQNMRDYLTSTLISRAAGPFSIRDSLRCKRMITDYAERWDSLHGLYTTHLRMNQGFSTERRREFYTNPFNYAAQYAEIYHDTCIYHDLSETATGKPRWEDLLVVLHWLYSQLTCSCEKSKRTNRPGYCALRCTTCKDRPQRQPAGGSASEKLLRKSRSVQSSNA